MGRVARHLAAGIVVVGLGAVSLSACGQPAPEEKADVIVGRVADADARSAGAILSRASESTSAVESGRIRISYSMSGAEDGEMFDLTMAGTGSFTDFGQRAELTLDVSGGPGAGVGGMPLSMEMRQIVDGTTGYIKVESAQSIPGFGDGWMKFDVSDVAGSEAGTGMGVTGWSGFLDSLKGAGASVAETGTDTVDGVPVTVYEGTIDPEAAMAAASPEDADDVQAAIDQMGGTFEMPFTAWVDADGMVRRLEMRVTAGMGPASVNLVMTIEFYDFGAPVTIEVPPPDEVTEGPFSAFGGFGGLGTA